MEPDQKLKTHQECFVSLLSPNLRNRFPLRGPQDWLQFISLRRTDPQCSRMVHHGWDMHRLHVLLSTSVWRQRWNLYFFWDNCAIDAKFYFKNLANTWLWLCLHGNILCLMIKLRTWNNLVDGRRKEKSLQRLNNVIQSIRIISTRLLTLLVNNWLKCTKLGHGLGTKSSWCCKKLY